MVKVGKKGVDGSGQEGGGRLALQGCSVSSLQLRIGHRQLESVKLTITACITTKKLIAKVRIHHT